MKHLHIIILGVACILGTILAVSPVLNPSLPEAFAFPQSESTPSSESTPESESTPSSGNSSNPLGQGLQDFGSQDSGLRTEGSLISFISGIISWGLGLVGTVFFVIILLNGFKYMTSGGSASSSQESVKAITNAIIGLVIIMGAFLITNYVTSALLGA